MTLGNGTLAYGENKKDNEMPNDPQEEIDRLKGELATARWCIAFLFRCLLAAVDDETRRAILDKISSISSISDNDFIRHESDRFKDEFLRELSKSVNIELHDDPPKNE